MVFGLTTKYGEVITRKTFKAEKKAIEYFADIKKLSVDELLKIYDVIKLS